MLRRHFFLLTVPLLLCGCAGGGGTASNETSVTEPPPLSAADVVRLAADRYRIGAVYYFWYPENFSQGSLRAMLTPEQQPALGWYASDRSDVVEQHIAWASSHGVDFFLLNWWPDRPWLKSRVDTMMNAPNIGDISFALFYETWSFGYSYDDGATIMTPAVIDRFVTDVLSATDKLFSHPSYLTVDGRPVIYFYLTRVLMGDYTEAFTRLRAAFSEKGVNPIFVADEIFWFVARKGDPSAGEGAVAKATDPQTDRIALFDALTAYNLYESQFPSHEGYASQSPFIADAITLYRRYAATGKPIIPNVIPGYNDRGVRLDQNHYVIPRQYAADRGEGSLMGALFDQVVFPLMDDRLSMAIITSWNEWNEDTAIEPVTVSDPVRDKSPDGQSYTQGYRYPGYGTAYLETVRNKVVAVTGSVADGATPVCAWAEGVAVACDYPDSRRFYTLSRRRMPPGEYEVGLFGQEERRPVTVTADRCVTGVDF